MHFINFLTPSYYFNTLIDPTFRGFWVAVGVCGAILLAAIILQWRLIRYSKKWSGDVKFWWAHWTNMGYAVSVVGLLHLFFRNQTIPYANWRFWPALMVISVTAWIGYLIYYRLKLLPKRQADRAVKKNLAYYFRRRRK